MNRLFPILFLAAAILLTNRVTAVELTPSDHIHYYSPMLGAWKMTIKTGDVTIRGTSHWRLGANGKCLLIDSSDESGTSGQSVQGFDPRTNTWQMAWFDKDGNFTQGTLDPVDFEPGETLSVGPIGMWKDFIIKDGEAHPQTATASCLEVSKNRVVFQWKMIRPSGEDGEIITIEHDRSPVSEDAAAISGIDAPPEPATSAQATLTQDLDYFIGNWIWEGEIKLAGQPAETFLWRHNCEKSLDGRFLLEKQYDVLEGLRMKHVALIGSNGKDEAIRGWGFWAPPGGHHEEVVYTKTDKGWRITRDGLDGIVTIINKDSWKYEADFERNGAENHWGFTARRIKPPTEADAKRVIGMLAGKWNLSFDENGTPTTAKITATPSASKLVLQLTYQVPGDEPATGMFAWHATKKQIVETWFRNGEHVRICFDGLTEDGALIGPGEGMLEGKRFHGIRILKFHSPDHYTHTIRGQVSDGESEPEGVLTGNRASDERLQKD